MTNEIRIFTMNSNTMAEQKKFTYRNASGLKQTLMGVGVVMPGQTAETDVEIDNPNFVRVDTRRFVNVEAPVTQPDPNSVVQGVERANLPKKGNNNK